MQLVGGVTLFDIPVGKRGNAARGKYSNMVFFLYDSCFWFLAVWFVIPSTTYRGMLNKLSTSAFYSIISHYLGGSGVLGTPQMTTQQSLSALSCFLAALVELTKSIPVHT